MLYRAKRAVKRAKFNFVTKRVFSGPALKQKSDNVAVVTMICHGEVSMYLLAIRSFCYRFGTVPRIILMNDGSLTAGDVRKLTTHLPDAEVLRISDIATGVCPTGGCWERLLFISELVGNSYVVQLDCDTLTLADIPEIQECVRENRSFTLLGDSSHPLVEPMLEACERYGGSKEDGVQAVCERSFDQLEKAPELRYLRGNAGFTGFAKGSITRERVEWFSQLMRPLAQGKWDNWGSEQLASNLLIANSDKPLPLPFPKYLSHWARPEVCYENSAFIHFIGPQRFAKGLYIRMARIVLRDLRLAISER